MSLIYICIVFFFFFFKQKTAYEMRISDWSSDVCSSDLLALEAYAHFTSPIRRYPDLLVHRAIKHALAGGDPDRYRYSHSNMSALSLQCSERSRRADEAQREVDDRYRAAWMEQHVGSEFDGVISGVTSFGLFIALDESKVNGLVHVPQLPNDYYHFDPIRNN